MTFSLTRKRYSQRAKNNHHQLHMNITLKLKKRKKKNKQKNHLPDCRGRAHSAAVGHFDFRPHLRTLKNSSDGSSSF